MNFTLKIWRQKNKEAKGNFTYKVDGIIEDMSFLKIFDVLNNGIILQRG